MNYTIEEVTDERQAREFTRVAVELYRGDPNWVRPLDDDIRKVFDPARNPCFTRGECARWIARDERGRLAGRVAAFTGNHPRQPGDYAVGGMGFFECVNDHDAARGLFDRCQEWLQARGAEAMEGPENFGERNSWWGLLVEGFEPANYGMPYNPPYYRALFEGHGFRDYFQQYTYLTHLVKENLSPVVVWKSDRLLKNKAYKLRSLDDIPLSRAKEAFMEIYNRGWSADLHGVENMDKQQVDALFKNLRPVIDPELIYFAFHDEHPIGFFIMIPELNYIIKHLNGNTRGWNALKFLYYRHACRGDVALGLIFGVIPEFQGRGVEAALIKYFRERIVDRGSHYRWLQMSWVGDFNKPQMHLMEYIGAKKCKTHVTYRKLFRDDIEFRRLADKRGE
ncbi:MAG: hypothetical protein LBF09_04695 [Odoribacteraceae bacterium]|jgi:GNAT superfamily N-acetyltransferase|nr:hypothetical protein [Odoribacteraceae bacterium]